MYIFPSQQNIARQLQQVFDVFLRSEGTIRPHCFISGPSGSGKSFLVEALARNANIPNFEMNAAQLTIEGVSGNSLSKAIKPLKKHSDQPNIIFVDEFDKLIMRNGSETAGAASGVQDEFLHVLEANETDVFGTYGNYDRVSVEHTLFIFAGAFGGKKIHTPADLSETGIRKEFIGRIPMILHTDKVTYEEMRAMITESGLLTQYMAMYKENRGKNKIVNDLHQELEWHLANYDTGLRSIDAIIHNYFIEGRHNGNGTNRNNSGRAGQDKKRTVGTVLLAGNNRR